VNNSTGKYADSLYNKEKVFKTVSGKVMYGGGGIMPDIYVPIDTTGNTGFYYELSGKGVLNDFVFSSLLKNMTLPKSLNSLVKNFRLSDEQYGSLLAIAKGRNIKVTDGEALNSRSVIDTELKALIARYYYGDEGYYRVINSNDKALAKSLQVFDAEKSAGLISKK
jgi:carboxyl-terminal processing protease